MINNICIDCEVKEIFSKIESDNTLRDTSLEGVWKLIESEWQGKKVEDSDYTSFKIYSYPRFIWGQYHAKGKNFIGAGGGTYQYDGKKLIEHVEYLSFYEMEPGDLTAIITTLSPGVIRQVSNDGMGKEIWEKVRQ